MLYHGCDFTRPSHFHQEGGDDASILQQLLIQPCKLQFLLFNTHKLLTRQKTRTSSAYLLSSCSSREMAAEPDGRFISWRLRARAFCRSWSPSPVRSMGSDSECIMKLHIYIYIQTSHTLKWQTFSKGVIFTQKWGQQRGTEQSGLTTDDVITWVAIQWNSIRERKYLHDHIPATSFIQTLNATSCQCLHSGQSFILLHATV